MKVEVIDNNSSKKTRNISNFANLSTNQQTVNQILKKPGITKHRVSLYKTHEIRKIINFNFNTESSFDYDAKPKEIENSTLTKNFLRKSTKENPGTRLFFNNISRIVKKDQNKQFAVTNSIEKLIKTNSFPTSRFLPYSQSSLNLNTRNKLNYSKNTDKIQQNPENFKDIKELENPSFLPQYLKEKYKGFIPENKLQDRDQAFSLKRVKSMVVAIKKEKDDYDNKYDQTKKDSMVHQNKIKLKWATIKWLIDHKKNELTKLITFHKKIIFSTNVILNKTKKTGFSKSKFFDIMRRSGISQDSDFLNKLFWVFDDDGSGEIDFKEIVSGIEMFLEPSTKLKIKSFFELCDTDHSGSINRNELYNIMKKNIISRGERINLRRVIDKIFKDVGKNNGELSLEQFYLGCDKNEQIFEIIEKNMETLNTIENAIENEVKMDFMNFKPETDQRLRKVFNIPEIFYPPIEKKFSDLIQTVITNKVLILSLRKR